MSVLQENQPVWIDRKIMGKKLLVSNITKTFQHFDAQTYEIKYYLFTTGSQSDNNNIIIVLFYALSVKMPFKIINHHPQVKIYHSPLATQLLPVRSYHLGTRMEQPYK